MQDTSEILRTIVDDLDTESVSVAQLVETLEQRSFGGLIVLLSLLGLIPGISVLAGLVTIVLAVQIISGRETPKMPTRVSKRRLNVVKMKRLMRRPLIYVSILERYVKPRWPLILSPAITRFNGLVILCLALVMISPMPLSNILPALALFPIALGLLEQDGLVTVVGWLASVVAIVVGIFMLFAAIELARWFFSQ